MIRNFLLITLLGLFVFFNAGAQTTGEVRGFVYDKETGEPLIFTTVFLQEIMIGKATDINGFFSLTKIQPGTYTLKCVALGYDTASSTVMIKAGAIVNQKLFATKVSQKLEEVNVSAERTKILTFLWRRTRSCPIFTGITGCCF
ncbi:MAG: carboxypeptidase-like regulatory domain-containing protein [Bacteroidota bacterium]